MKNLYTLIFTLLSLSVYADSVDQEVAKKIANNFLSQNITSLSTNARMSGQKNFELNLVYPKQFTINNARKSSGKNTPFYIYNFENGFIIVSNEDAVYPVLGYSFEGNYNDTLISPEFRKWIETYKKQIRYVQINNIKATEEIKALWKNLQNDNNQNKLRTAKTTSVKPLLQTNWDQKGNYYENPDDNLYNSKCPRKYFWSDRALTGCVATAMAQIMKFHNFPAKGTGFHSYNHTEYGTLSANFSNSYYDWNNMPNQLYSFSSSQEIDAVSRLMLHCGISIDMGYGVKSSGISSLNPVSEALKRYFGYSNTVSFVERVNYSDEDWKNLIFKELDAGRPVEYAGIGNGGGHAFVCDGYDDNGFFHMNWGWSGVSNGYFLLDALDPNSLGAGGGDGGYNSNQQAVIGIQPSTNQNINLQLYSSLSVVQGSEINYGDPFNVETNFFNNGATQFSGDYAVGVFNNQGTFIDYVEVKEDYSLDTGLVYTDDINFSNAGSFELVPSTYHLIAMYRTDDGEWSAIENGDYLNLQTLKVNGPKNDLELYDSLNVSTKNIIQDNPFDITLNIANYGSTDFEGDYSLDLFTFDGDWVTEIDFKENMSLQAGYYYVDGLTFSSSGLNVELGSYLLVLTNREIGGDWTFVGASDTYPNPVSVIVEAPPTIADIYEENNSISDTYVFSPSFSSDEFSMNTSESNIHIESDVDYYEVDLPPGYDYTISARLHDSYNSGNGNNYSCDVGFSIYNGIEFSETFDDVMPSKIHLQDGGTIIFKVAPYFAGLTGTYLLDLSIERSDILGVRENQEITSFTIYPNPTSQKVSIQSNQLNKVEHIRILNQLGQTVLSFDNFLTNDQIPLEGLSSGLYFVQIKQGDFIETKKLLIQ